MIRAYINQHFPGDVLDVAILNVDPEGRHPKMILELEVMGEGDRRWLSRNWRTLNEESHIYRPTLSLGYEEGRALLGALATYFDGGVDDARLLRQDYTAERGRVDKLIDVVSTIARSATEGLER